MAILIVDDSRESQIIIEHFLKAEGYNQIISFGNGNDAFSFLKDNFNKVDLILMDINMPDIDGIEATRLIKGNLEFKDIPIIIVTVLDTKISLEEAFNAGAIDYITKPISRVELKCRVKSILKFKYEMDCRKKRESELQKEVEAHNIAKEELLRIKNLESIGFLAGGIAHDYNNILTAIMGGITLAKLYLKQEDKAVQPLIKAEDSILRAKELTEQLLTFAKGGLPIKRPTQISSIFKKAIKSISDISANINYVVSIGKDIWFINADYIQISNVFKHLLTNAVEAMPLGGTVYINVENIVLEFPNPFLLESGRYLKISIKDQGKGITKEIYNKIFDPYFTTKDRGIDKGIGLGLSICYSIIKKHDGCITFESNDGAGTTFFVYLPAAL
ncbi:MAG: response regulator [Desulfobacterales bacterium]|nr:response regulator [Desulfobacterales bacterium]